jgi:hypothetical protein
MRIKRSFAASSGTSRAKITHCQSKSKNPQTAPMAPLDFLFATFPKYLNKLHAKEPQEALALFLFNLFYLRSVIDL